MRAVFCGTPEFAVGSLAAVVAAGVTVPLVVSQPDRVRGRRGKPSPSPVRQHAIEAGIETAVLERGSRDVLYDRILDLDPDVVVVVAFGHILREPLLHGARFGCVNVHASLLPRWRGPAPIHTAIVAGDSETGVCTMKLEAGVDTGDVYECARTAIGPVETAGELHDRLASLGAKTLVSTLRGLDAGTLVATPQSESGVTHAPMLDRSEGSVDFRRDAAIVHDRIRGMDPWPSTTVEWEGRRVKLSGSCGVEAVEGAAPGEVLAVDASGVLLGCGSGAVRVGALQAEGKQKGAARDFAHGYGLAPGQVMHPLPGFSSRPPR